MEYYLNQPPRSYVLIKVLFAIISIILIAFLILFCTLSIDQKVSFNMGEIISQNPNSDFRVPYEAVMLDLRVQEGEAVQQGDTLAILQNTKVEFDFANIEKNKELQKQQVLGLQEQIASLENTIQQQEQQRKLYADKHQLNQKSAKLDLKSIKHQVFAKQQDVNMQKEQLDNSERLLSTGSISRSEHESFKQKYLNATTELSILTKRMEQADGKDDVLDNEYSTNLNRFELNLLESKNKKSNLVLKLNEERIRIQQLEEQVLYRGTEVAKSYIISDKAGQVSNLYNNKKASNFMQKGTLLLSIVPDDDQGFYAKAMLSQHDIKQVEKGQKAQLRLNAFSFMKFGIIKGEVSFINKSEKNEFFVLIEITEPNETIKLKNGYAIKGDIVVKRVKLYQFAYEKLLQK